MTWYLHINKSKFEGKILIHFFKIKLKINFIIIILNLYNQMHASRITKVLVMAVRAPQRESTSPLIRGSFLMSHKH